MQDTRTLIIGTDMMGWNLHGSYQIAGVTIDNKCGSWLWIPQDNTFIPPFTLGFAHNFSPTISHIDIRFMQGPSGQVSTTLGDQPVATIYDRSLSESVGSSQQSSVFIPTQQSSAFGFIADYLVTVTAGGGGTLVPGIAGRRIRVLSLGLCYEMPNLDPLGRVRTTLWQDSPVSLLINGYVATPPAIGSLVGTALFISGHARPSDSIVLGDTLAGAASVGVNLDALLETAFADALVMVYGQAVYV